MHISEKEKVKSFSLNQLEQSIAHIDKAMLTK